MLGGPPQPDFTGAAQAQSAASRQLTTEQTYANRPNISTPWGGIRWTPPAYDPYYAGGGGGGGGASGGPDYGFTGRGFTGRGFTGRGGAPGGGGGGGAPGGGGGAGRAPDPWGMELYLSPEQQSALEAQQRLQRGRSDIAESMLGRARGELGQGPDFSALPEAGGAVSPDDTGNAQNRAEEALYQRSTSRLNPEWEQRQQQLDTQLRSQGIQPGSAAYARQMADFERGREAAFTGARQEAISGGGAEAQRLFGMRLQSSQYATQRRNQAIGEILQRRGWTLNEINALMSGQQVGMPQFPGFTPAGAAQPPNYTGAAAQQYAAGLDAYNARQAQLQSLFGAGSSYFGGGYSPFSF